MINAQHSEGMPLSKVIAKTCNELVLQLAGPAPSGISASEVENLRVHLSSLGSLLKMAPLPESLAGLSNAVQDCQVAVAKIKESLSRSPAGSMDHMEEMAAPIRSLIDARNILSLRLNMEHITDETSLKTLKSGLDKLSREVMAAADSFFPHQRPLRQPLGKFTVQEREIMVRNRNTNPRSGTYEIVCPSASFFPSSKYGHSSGKTIKFICCCDGPGESHNSRLQYSQVDKLLEPCELVRPGTERTWQMYLYKNSTRAIVSVRLTGVVPTYIREVQDWSLNLALKWAVGLRLKKDLDNTRSSYAVSTSDTLLLRTTVCDEDLFRKSLPRQIVIHALQGDVQLDFKPSDMQACCFSQAFWDEIDSGSENDWQPSKLLLPQPWVRLLFNSRQASPVLIQVDHSLAIDISKVSTVVNNKNHSKGQPRVQLLRVQVHQGQVTEKCDMSFEFNTLEDAENFAHQVDQMRLWLLRVFAQGLFAGEAEVYVHDSSALPTTGYSGVLPKINLSVISSKQAGGKSPKMRMIVMRDGFPGSFCLDFGSNALQVSEMGLHNSDSLTRYWRHYYKDGGIATTEETHWQKIVLQRRDSTRTRQLTSSGGTQIQRNQRRTAEDWLSNTDQLQDIMTSDNPDDKYDRVKVCVIDTGLREDYKTTCEAFRGFRDFVDPGNKGVCDRSASGHGTLCAHIVLSIFDKCELYVARVFADEDADDATGSERMADAIEWAASEEVGADIISISAGFKVQSERLEKVVLHAGNKTLIFASASNWGNLDGVAAPARHEGAICIFSTDTADRPSKFNPAPQQDKYNFAFMGEEWQSCVNAQRYERGTSMATAAAAGLAGLILDFSRQSDNRSKSWARQVCQRSGMTAIFREIQKPAGQFLCVEPRHLLKNYGDTTADDKVNPKEWLQQRRQWVSFKIEAAINRKVYGIN